MSAARINTAELGSEQFASTLPIDPAADGLAYSAELVDRVTAEAADATRYPRLFWVAAVLVVLGSIVASRFWPLGFAL